MCRGKKLVLPQQYSPENDNWNNALYKWIYFKPNVIFYLVKG